MELLYHLIITHFGISPKMQNTNSKGYMHPYMSKGKQRERQTKKRTLTSREPTEGYRHGEVYHFCDSQTSVCLRRKKNCMTRMPGMCPGRSFCCVRMK
ncbi:unnamed protein product [Nyctereutes procyonoides]|uniref:(raccoon dog) hypothetical protein n=1 Tax=Nyctereutes procyonoides TaxID=34880 RepID=A0A811YW56_NYCPR|nr:unnamed protein product [Nyctereutes procyonoides]